MFVYFHIDNDKINLIEFFKNLPGLPSQIARRHLLGKNCLFYNKKHTLNMYCVILVHHSLTHFWWGSVMVECVFGERFMVLKVVDSKPHQYQSVASYIAT